VSTLKWYILASWDRYALARGLHLAMVKLLLLSLTCMACQQNGDSDQVKIDRQYGKNELIGSTNKELWCKGLNLIDNWLQASCFQREAVANCQGICLVIVRFQVRCPVRAFCYCWFHCLSHPAVKPGTTYIVYYVIRAQLKSSFI